MRDLRGVQPKADRACEQQRSHSNLHDRVFEKAFSNCSLAIRYLRFTGWSISRTYRDVDQKHQIEPPCTSKTLQIPCCHTQQLRMSIQRVTRQLEPFSTSSRHLAMRIAQSSNAAETRLPLAQSTVPDFVHLPRSTCSSVLGHAQVTAVSRSAKRSAEKK